MDNELFIKLLESNNRLIVPEFGAFLKKSNDQSHEIVFTPFLKKDDGVLSQAISNHFQVDPNEAGEIVIEFVKEIKSKLATNGRYYFESLGTITNDANGALSFTYDPAPKTPIQTHRTPAEPVISNVETPRVVSDQSPMKSMMIGQTQPQSSPNSRTNQSSRLSDNDPIRPRSIDPVHTTSHSTQSGRMPLSQSTTRIPSPQPHATNADRQGQPLGGNANTRQGQAQPQSGSRPSPRAPQKGINAIKTDVWLIVAIVAALIVIGLIIYGYVNTDPQIPLEPLTEEVVNTNNPG